MHSHTLRYLIFALFWTLTCSLSAQRVLEQRIADSLNVIAADYFYTSPINRVNIQTNQRRKTVEVTASENFGFFPFRPHNVHRIYQAIGAIIANTHPQHTLRVEAYGRDIRELIPIYFSETPHSNRFFTTKTDSPPLVTNLSRPYTISNGLFNSHIALWNSHGVYYNQAKNLWEWQRPMLFQTVEDMLTTSFVLPFLAPMLENAGANIFLPRERDIQLNEVIVDNDNPENSPSRYKVHNQRKSWTVFDMGFAHPNAWYVFGENPFTMGTSKTALTVTNPNDASKIEWIPHIPETGLYAVYVSYRSFENSIHDARYTVHHQGGKTVFSVNQTMFGGSWLYLGHFQFEEGRSQQGKVELHNISTVADGIVSADAVKIGGGMGNIARTPLAPNNEQPTEPSVSQFPRFMEGARYWLQWAGVPDSVYSRTGNTNDYSDDFQSRGFWVNYLSGGSTSNPGVPGLQVPLSLAFAFHTDAGIRHNDSIVGTLGICTVLNSRGTTTFRNGVSRWASRDLTDLIQSEIVNDIREVFHSQWTRRGLWNRSYSESRNPEVPTMLLELLSHQNFEDMRYAHDPRFRFIVSRAIYKAILKHTAFVNGFDYVVQPLPVENFRIQFVQRNRIRLQWDAVTDTLEPTATPKQFVVYTRVDDGGFDNGRIVNSTRFDTTIVPGKIYSFKVAAVNAGGKSFPSEILAAHRNVRNRSEVLIINAFERVSGPDVKSTHEQRGFLSHIDNGVPYLYCVSYVGPQYNFTPESLYVNNQNPGFGSSKSYFQNQVIAGNTFDYPFVHGKSIKYAGYSFVSTSVKTVLNNEIDLSQYGAVNVILGKQKHTFTGKNQNLATFATFPQPLQHRLREYLEQGGRLLVSGAFVVSDVYTHGDEGDRQFLSQVLKVQPQAIDVPPTGQLLYNGAHHPNFFGSDIFTYQQTPDRHYYMVEKPDYIEPASPLAFVFSTMNGTEAGLGVAYSGKYRTCILSIPFETINEEESRNKLMNSILHFLFRRK